MSGIRRNAPCPCGSGISFKHCCGTVDRYSAHEMLTSGIDLLELRRMIGRPDAVILDIGSNDGGTSAEVLRVLPHARIFCFEPDPRAIARWRAANHPPAMTLIETAVGAADGKQVFFQSSGQKPDEQPREWDLSGSLRRPKGHHTAFPWVKFESQIEVPTIRLDRWFAQSGLDRVDLIWADVQGAEAELIAGASATLRRTTLFYTEYANEEVYEGQATLRQMRAMLPDFAIAKLFDMDVLFRRRADP